LHENDRICFGGCKAYGQGFLLDPEEAAQWISEDPTNRGVLFPYLTGEDINSRPAVDAPRWAIDFNNRTRDEASAFSRPFTRVVETVKPERQRRNAKGDFVLRKPLPQRWWLYADRRPGLRQEIECLDHVLAIAVVSKVVMPIRVPTGQVFSHRIAVFATDSFAQQALLSSSIHWNWAVTYSSTLETRVSYSPSDCFLTFPRSPETEALHAIGRTLDEERREIMLRRELGLTKLYNLVNDPDLPTPSDPDAARLRAIHVELDETVMAAYGWSDVPLDHGFHTYRQMTRWTVGPSARVEILDRLLEENPRRGAAEAAAGMGAAPAESDAVDDFDPDAEEAEA